MRRRFYTRRPQEISNVFAGRGLTAKLKNLVPLYQVQKKWVEIAGAEIAQRTQPVRIEKNRLVVRVESPSWKMHLEFMKTDLLDKIMQVSGLHFDDLQLVPGQVEPLKSSPAPAEIRSLPQDWERSTEPTAKQDLFDIMNRVRGKMGFLSKEPRS